MVHRRTFMTSHNSSRRPLTRHIGTFRPRVRRILFRSLWAALAPVSLYIPGLAQSPASSTSPPPYQSLRYDEDWTYLSDKSQRSDAFDSLKYVPLHGSSYLSLGGEARVRYEYFNQFNFGAGSQDRNGY